jgi:hypothetical protein
LGNRQEEPLRHISETLDFLGGKKGREVRTVMMREREKEKGKAYFFWQRFSQKGF